MLHYITIIICDIGTLCLMLGISKRRWIPAVLGALIFLSGCLILFNEGG